MKMDVFEAILGRRSVRLYKPDPVPKKCIERILDAARWAPSGSNIQPWKFIVVSDKNVLEVIRKMSPGYLGETPLAILVCSDREKEYRVGGTLGRDYMSVADCSMAVENMLLAAHALGLGTCVVKSFSRIAVKEMLEIPDSIEPELLVVLGYAAQAPTPPARPPLGEITFLNRYGRKFPTSLDG
jgi:nitroreductase